MLEYFFTFFWTNALFSYVAKAMFYIRNSTLWFNHNQQQQLSDKSSWDEKLAKFCIAGTLEIHLFDFSKISWLTKTFRWTDSHLTISNTVKHQEFGFQRKNLKHSQAQPVYPQGQGHRKNNTMNYCRRNDKEVSFLKLITLIIKPI